MSLGRMWMERKAWVPIKRQLRCGYSSGFCTKRSWVIHYVRLDSLPSDPETKIHNVQVIYWQSVPTENSKRVQEIGQGWRECQPGKGTVSSKVLDWATSAWTWSWTLEYQVASKRSQTEARELEFHNPAPIIIGKGLSKEYINSRPPAICVFQ